MADYRIKAKLRVSEKDCVEEIVKTLNEDKFERKPEMIRALIPACVSFQIPVKLGVKLVAQTAALFWSVEHVLSNFEVCKIEFMIWLTCSSFSLTMASVSGSR